MKATPFHWKVEKPELSQAHSQILQNAQERVDLAFKAFFRRVKAGEKPGYPRFKGYRRYDSFTYKQSGFDLLDTGLLLSKIGTIKIIKHRPSEGKIKTLTIRRDAVGNWYACFSCEVDERPLPPNNKVVLDGDVCKIAIQSDCAAMQRLAKELTEVNPYQEISYYN